MYHLRSINFFLALALIPASCSFAQDTDLEDLDTDEDGKVSVAEFEKYASGKLAGFDRLSEFAKAVDADGDGTVSEDEFAGRQGVLRAVVTREAAPAADAAEKPAEGSSSAAFAKISKLLKGGKWEEAAKYMTQNAQDEIVVEQVISSAGMLKMAGPIPIPELDKAKDNIKAAMEKHKLDKLDIDVSSMFRVETQMEGMDDEGDDEDADKEKDSKEKMSPEKTLKDAQQKILNAVNKSGNRWEIVKDLWDAKTDSPLAMSALIGKVDDVETKDDESFLRVTPAQSETDGSSGVMVQIMSPPVVYRMIEKDGNWMLDGRDQQRTLKSMSEFMKKQGERMRGGQPPARQDF